MLSRPNWSLVNTDQPQNNSCWCVFHSKQSARARSNCKNHVQVIPNSKHLQLWPPPLAGENDVYDSKRTFYGYLKAIR